MEERGQLLTAIFSYRTGEPLPDMTTGVKVLYSIIKGQIERDTTRYNEICEIRKENGKKGAEFGQLGAEFGKLGGRPKKLASYDDIISNSELPPPVQKKLGAVLQHFSLNKHDLKNDELQFIIDRTKIRKGEEKQLDYLRDVICLSPSELFG